MRNGVWAAVTIWAIAATNPAHAQSSLNNPLGGPSPANIQFKPIDMSTVVATPSLATQNNTFSFSNLFHRLTVPGAKPLQGVSPLPSPSSFPTYPNAQMVGTPPYQLGNPAAARFPFLPVIPILNPIKPITPGNP
jgi:hypothetical protein